MAGAVTYTREAVIEILNDREEQFKAEHAALVENRVAASKEVYSRVMARVRSTTTPSVVAQYTTDIDDAVSSLLVLDKENVPYAEKAQAAYALMRLLETNPLGTIRTYDLTRGLDSITTAEQNMAKELKELRTRRTLIRTAGGTEFTLTALERLGVLRFFK